MRVPLSVETYFVTNLLMNAVTLAVVARMRGRVQRGNVLFAAAFGALYAVVMRLPLFAQLNHPACKILLSLALSLIAIPARSPWSVIGNTALLCCAAAMQAGLLYWVLRVVGRGLTGYMLGALAGGVALYMAVRQRAERLERLEADTRICLDGVEVRITALVDTGNRLREPLTGNPVLIVEAKRLRPLLPLSAQGGALPPGFRWVGYGGLGGSGKMPCFLPDRLLVRYRRTWLSARDVWVAAYPGAIPGGAEALAPAVIGRVREETHPGGVAGWRRFQDANHR